MEENNKNDNMENEISSDSFSDGTNNISEKDEIESVSSSAFDKISSNEEEKVSETSDVEGSDNINDNVIEESAEETESYMSEYGNTVRGQQASSSLYSYSYKDNSNTATRSGDYHANEMPTQDAGNQNSAYQQGNAYNNGYGNQSGNGSNEQYGNNPNAYGNGYNNQYGAGNQNINNSNSYESGTGSQYSNNSYNYGSNNNFNDDNGMKQRDKKPLSFGKKLAVCVALAVVFGLVAGVCFQGVRFVANRSGLQIENRENTDKVKIGGQADTVGTTSVATGSAVGGMMDVSGIVEQTMPAIVAITSTFEGASYNDIFGRYYQNQESTSCGSGFIVGKNDSELLITTNNHVINGAKTISVQFIDDEVCEASVKGTDSSNDLAVIAVKLNKIKKSTMEKVKIADLGNSDDLKVGEMAIAIGNALGYGQSVTVGYISAKDREIEETSETDGTVNKIKAIQTDAAINPGNSGGALMNISGQVIGINSAKIAASTVEGVGYAIPISQAIPIIDNLKTKENLTDDEKGYLGIKGRTVSDELSVYNMPNGVYVAEVAEGGAAAKGGILVGDIITSIESMEVRTIQSLVEKANSYRKGTKVKITLQRSNNGVYEEKKVTVTLQGKSSLNGLSDDDSTDSDNNNNNNYYGYGDNGYGDSDRGNDNNNGNDNNYGNEDDYGNDGEDDWFSDFLNPFGY